MTIERMKAEASVILRSGVDTLKMTGGVPQVWHIFKYDGTAEIINFVGADLLNMLGDRLGSELVAKVLRQRVAEGDVEAVIMVTDATWARVTEKQWRKVEQAGLDVEQAGRAGMVEPHESVLVTIEAPCYQEHISQEYVRHEDRIILVGEPEHFIPDGVQYKACGRFHDLWPKGQPQ